MIGANRKSYQIIKHITKCDYNVYMHKKHTQTRVFYAHVTFAAKGATKQNLSNRLQVVYFHYCYFIVIVFVKNHCLMLYCNATDMLAKSVVSMIPTDYYFKIADTSFSVIIHVIPDDLHLNHF